MASTVQFGFLVIDDAKVGRRFERNYLKGMRQEMMAINDSIFTANALGRRESDVLYQVVQEKLYSPCW